MDNLLPDKVFYEIRPPKDLEHSAEDFARCLLAISQIKKASFLDRWQGRVENLTFEMAAVASRVHFYAIVPVRMATYFESQIASSYPKAKVARLDNDYLAEIKMSSPQVAQLGLTAPFYFPLRTYKSDKETDSLSAVLGALSKSAGEETVVFQINLANGGSWQGVGRRVLTRGIPDPEGKFRPHPQAKLIEEKIAQKGFEVSLRLFADSPDPAVSKNIIANLSSAFGSMGLGEGNSLSLKKPAFFGGSLLTPFLTRSFLPAAKYQYLNVDEIATLFHLPDTETSQIKNLSWGGEAFTDPPVNLPVALNLSEEEKQKINFFARSEYRNKQTTFGIKDGEDRRKHFYIIGKTGTGKSTLIANMAISDIRKGHGVAIIDPHGDLSETILNYIPADRINDVAYLDPAQAERSFHLNPLEVQNHEQGDIVSSGIVSIFHKLYSFSWGPRLEYILRNTIMTLVKKPGTTFLDIPRILNDNAYRKSLVDNLDDPVLKNFWIKEYNAFAESFRQEAISPILNKVGQFLSSPRIRNIVGYPTSTIDLSEIMEKEKILILNLSQGRLGEDNSALLGALFITKFQLAAMNRVGMPEAQRKDFYLYVDEFQNFATTSFIKILSEARKYHLNLVLANQYIAQLDEAIQKAVFGNVGSLVAFTLGAADAKAMFVEFGKALTEEELVNLARYQIAVRLSIEQATSGTFLAQTLPLPDCANQNREKVIRASMERYTKLLETPLPPPVINPEPVAVGPKPPAPTPRPVVSPAQVSRPPQQNNYPWPPRPSQPQGNFRPKPHGPRNFPPGPRPPTGDHPNQPTGVPVAPATPAAGEKREQVTE